MCGKSIQIQVKFDFKAKWKLFYLDICNTFETNQNFSASSFQNMSEINKITSETRFDWILNFVCFFSAFLRRSSLFCADGIRVVRSVTIVNGSTILCKILKIFVHFAHIRSCITHLMWFEIMETNPEEAKTPMCFSHHWTSKTIADYGHRN